MKTFESGWQNRQGIKFYVRGWEPDGLPEAIILLLHGLGEHIGRYAHVAQALQAGGYALAGFDLRGHGQSGGPRGHFPSLEAVMQDIQEFWDLLRGRYPGLPLFIYGHSLGGLLALTFALQRQPQAKGVIASAPGLRSALQEQKVKIVLARVLGSLVPRLTLPSGLDANMLSHDPRVVEAYLHDPLVHDKTTTAFGKTALTAIDYVFEHAAEFRLPLLIMYGSEDRLTYPSGGEELARRTPGDVTLRLWEGMAHEVHNEPQKAEVFRFVLEWLDSHLK